MSDRDILWPVGRLWRFATFRSLQGTATFSDMTGIQFMHRIAKSEMYDVTYRIDVKSF